MYKVSEFTKPVYQIGEAAKFLGVSTQTLHEYDKQGKLTFFRSEGGHRRIKREELLEFLKEKGMLTDESNLKRDVIYARVPNKKQRDNGTLDKQAMFIIEHIPNLQNPLILKEIGSGVNDKREQLTKLIQMVLNEEVHTVYVTYKDRLTRFGYAYLEAMFQSKGVKIVVLNDYLEQKNIEQELVEDMKSLTNSFSNILYRLKKKRGGDSE